MKYLFAAACALAITLAASNSHAQSKGGGGIKSGTTSTKISVPPVIQRDHRGPYLKQKMKGGVLVYKPCYTRHCHSH
jgi:hypothetical protein